MWTEVRRVEVGRRSRGNALVLAILIILSLTSVGVLAIQRTGTDLAVAANVTRAGRAQVCGNAGMANVVNMVGKNPTTYRSMAAEKRRVAADVQVATTDRYHTKGTNPVLSTDTSTSTPIVAAGNEDAAALQGCAYRVDRRPVPWSEEPVVGYSANSDICKWSVDFDAFGAIPKAGETPEQSTDPTTGRRVGIRARAQVGPGPCELAGK